MLVVMKADATAEDVVRVCSAIEALGLTAHPIPGQSRTAIGITGNVGPVDPAQLSNVDGVKEVIRVTRPHKLTNREMKPEDSVIRVGDVEIGGPDVVVFAGPCSVESYEQMSVIARELKARGAHLLRGGAFKPRTSPYSFQGLGEEGLEILSAVRNETGLPIVSELLSTDELDLVVEHVDVIQVGARNMHNYALLRALGQTRKPVFLKRGLSATLEEFLLAAEYIMAGGNPGVILCERGIRTFSTHCRFTLDLSIVPVLKRATHLPVVVDPSHATGQRDLVLPMTRASVAAGADGVMVEVHPEPERAYSDGAQAITLDMFEELMTQVRQLGPLIRQRSAVSL